MTKHIQRFPLHCLIALALAACNPSGANDGSNSEQPPGNTPTSESTTEVGVFVLETGTFHQELLANGKLGSTRKADLKFRTDGTIENIHIAEGNRVQAGQLLATLNDEAQRLARQQAELRHRKAVLDYEDQLLRLGYRAADTAKLDERVKRIARLRSGLSDAGLELDKAEKELGHTRLHAPFAGKVANVKARAHNTASSFDYVCTLVDDRELHVEFAVLEQELGFIRASKSVSITPFSDSDTRYSGTVTGINPQVDKAGMVSVKALVRNNGDGLIDGMGVSVTISREIDDQLTVRKEAVLDRQGRKVVFTATEGGTAYWNYVEIGHENSTHYTIKSGLEPGDRVIHMGNFNLAHDKHITVQEGSK
ncbi:efflux RND transporter periplasmic adaptor subunit [Parapedobacter tibetensis]|uniref:efflux RND transporter periplasmic adaptor subunit n=1 Tax=Parapedobacter tibetensis TaxID=2972951 RepID=UPI00214D32DA|nr:efflux RND transporter periplasmic adaptor subunit [Parapedobacter tibetensis]